MISLFALALSAATVAAAPAKDAPPPCPVLSVFGSEGEGMGTFTVNLSGGDEEVSPTYNWSISAGTISSGQGTPSITIEAAKDNNVTATVDVGGYAPACNVSSSSTIIVQ